MIVPVRLLLSRSIQVQSVRLHRHSAGCLQTSGPHCRPLTTLTFKANKTIHRSLNDSMLCVWKRHQRSCSGCCYTHITVQPVGVTVLRKTHKPVFCLRRLWFTTINWHTHGVNYLPQLCHTPRGKNGQRFARVRSS